MNASPLLSSDIVDCILTSLPDFATLFSTILVCKSFHGVFRAHPSSILTSVATTQIDPEVLPCAIRLALFNRNKYLTSRTNYVERFPSEKKLSQVGTLMVTRHVGALAKNDNVVRELELFYSAICKDRGGGSLPILNSRESLRFRRALYRWWLFINLIAPCYLRPTHVAKGSGGSHTEDDDTDDDIDDVDDNDNGAGADAENVYLAKSNELRQGFLSEFPDDQVVEIWQIHNFMVFVSLSIRNATSESTLSDYLLLWHGPSAAAKVLRSLRSFNDPECRFTEVLDWDFGHPDPIWPGFSEYLLGKNYDISKVKTNIWDPIPGSDAILDSRVEDTEECDECHVAQLRPKLWSSSNWHLLPTVIVLEDILDSLPGTLSWNERETQPLRIKPWSFTHFVDLHVSPGTQDWSEGKILCRVCVLKVIGRKTFSSLRNHKAKYGPQLENCWYGYKCRTQRRDAHAVKLNHLCEPTRGD